MSARWSPERITAVTLALLAWPALWASGQVPTVSVAGDVLKIRAKGFAFLAGEPLARLKDGRTVRVELAVTVLAAPGRSPVATGRQTFALSYDLWEERFAVRTVSGRPQSISHLTEAAAETWCVEQLAVPLRALGSLGRDLPFWIRLEASVPNADETADPNEGGSFTLQALIDALSRRRRSESTTRALDAGPFRLRLRGGAPPSPR